MKRKTLIQTYSHLLDKYINENIKNTKGRKNKFNNFVYINYILRVLIFGDTWCNLVITHDIDESTIRKKFYYWRDKGIFDLAYQEMAQKYSKNRTFKLLFIDSTCIQNMNCSDNNDNKYYYKIKSKRQVKVSIICNNNNIPVSYEIHNPRNHDSTMIKPLIDKLTINLKNNTNLVGDKGYICKKKKYMKKGKVINLIVEPRKNQKKIMNDKEKKIYKLRYKVEQTFSHLKRSYKHISMINDRKLNNFKTFFLII
jgi:hypothetical protein